MPAPAPALAVHFATGLPGFPTARDFVLAPLDAHGPYLSLTASTGEPAFTAALPGAFFPDYTVPLPEPLRERLGLAGADDALLLVLLSGAPDGRVTANLLGPVVVNRRTGAAAQVVLEHQPEGAHAVALPAA